MIYGTAHELHYTGAGNLSPTTLYKKLFHTNSHLQRQARLTVLCLIIYFITF